MSDDVDRCVEVGLCVGVTTADGYLAVPQRREFKRNVARHADQLYLTTGSDHTQRLLDRIGTADAINHMSRATGQLIADHQRSAGTAHPTRQLVTRTHDIGAQFLRKPLLFGVARSNDYRATPVIVAL